MVAFPLPTNSNDIVVTQMVQGMLHRFDFDVTGGFVEGRFCWANYVAKPSERPHFGSVVLDLSNSSRVLIGQYAAYGALSDSVVTGFASLTKSD